MLKLKPKANMPDSRWVSLEKMAVGDGREKAFALPEAFLPYDVVVFVGHQRINVRNPVTGRSIEAVVEDGTVTFTEPVEDGEVIFAVALDAEVGDTRFKVFPFTGGAQAKLAKANEALKKGKLTVDQQNAAQYRISFLELIDDAWYGVFSESDDGEVVAVPCTRENREAFLDQLDCLTYGAFISQVSVALAKIDRKEKAADLGK